MNGIKLTFLITFLLTSCVTFSPPAPEKGVGKQKEQIKKIKAYLVVRSVSIENGTEKIENYTKMFLENDYFKLEGMSYRHLVKTTIDGVKLNLMQTGYFDDLIFTTNSENKGDAFVIRVDVLNEVHPKTSSVLNGIWAGFTIGSFGIIPYWEKNNFSYRFAVIKNNKTIGDHEINRKFTKAYSVLLLPMMPFYLPSEMEGKLKTEIYQNAVNSLSRSLVPN